MNLQSHPLLPIDDLTKPLYQKRQKAWRRYRRARTHATKIEARAEIGDVSRQLFAILRDRHR